MVYITEPAIAPSSRRHQSIRIPANGTQLGFPDIEPQPIPDWVVDEIRLNGTREQDFAGEHAAKTDEEFDFDQFTRMDSC